MASVSKVTQMAHQFARICVFGDVRVQFVEQSFEKVEDVVRQWMVERPEDVVTLESEAAKATSLRLNDAVKPFTLLFDFPVGFVVVICGCDRLVCRCVQVVVSPGGCGRAPFRRWRADR